jgi:hypothetical protein
MRPVLRSLSRNRVKSLLYTALLCAAFMAVILLINTLLLGFTVIERINALLIPYTDAFDISYDAMTERREIALLRNAVEIPLSSLYIAIMLLVLVCITLLPFVYRLFCLSRGYEMGVMRALGLSRARTWLRLSAENILLTGGALLTAYGAALWVHTPFAFLLLSVDDEMEAALTGIPGVSEALYAFNGNAALFALLLSAVTILIASVINISLINRNAPLKLIRDHK